MVDGLDAQQLRELIVRPTLQYIGLHNPAAENLVLGTALVESGAKFIKQVGGGPALGICQMEPETHDDIWANYLRYKPELAQKLQGLMTSAEITRGAAEMIGNLYYAFGMTRVHYLRAPDRLPASADVVGMARYWKRYYNTPLGAGTVEKAEPYFRVACWEAK